MMVPPLLPPLLPPIPWVSAAWDINLAVYDWGPCSWCIELCSSYSVDSSGPALLFLGTWLWLTSLQPPYSCHLPLGSQGICSCPEHLLWCPLVVQPLQLWSPCFSLISLSHIYQSEWNRDVLAIYPSGVYQWVDVLLSLGTQLDVVHVEEVADGCFTSELLSIATLCDNVPKGVQAYVSVQKCSWLWTGL